jgi:hypothetical protein
MSDDIVARLRAVLHNDRSVELMNREAADEIERMRELLGNTEQLRVERSDEIERLRRERDEARLEVRALQKKIGDTSTMLYDWDGYYNPHSQSGNIVEMAKLVEEAYSTLQGRSWNEEKSK